MKIPAPKGLITVYGDKKRSKRHRKRPYTRPKKYPSPVFHWKKERTIYIEAKRDKENVEISADAETKKVYLDDMSDRAVII
jgi:hypothetical protein